MNSCKRSSVGWVQTWWRAPPAPSAGGAPLYTTSTTESAARSLGRDLDVLLRVVHVEQVEAAAVDVAVGLEADRRVERILGGRDVRRLDRRQHVRTARRVAGLADVRDRVHD